MHNQIKNIFCKFGCHRIIDKEVNSEIIKGVTYFQNSFATNLNFVFKKSICFDGYITAEHTRLYLSCLCKGAHIVPVT